MKAFFADKALFRPVLPPLHLRSRDMALALALGDEDQLTVHEQAVDPLIYRAASELIRLDDEGTKTNIEAQGQVFDVLQTIEQQLAEVGASRFAASQILDSLKFYVSGLGADFARQAKAKPLYARVMVTDKEPTDMPDCKVSSLTCIDGNRIQGDDAGKMSMTLTLYGTSNAMSQGMSMQRVFESGKKKWLMVYYGTIEGADLNKFDTVDADLATLIQAVGAGGGASVEEIRAAIENGTLAPEVKQLIAAIAALNRTVEAARTPGAIENPEAKIAELKAAIAEIVQTIPDMQALPQVLLQTVAESIAPVDIAPETPDAGPVEASNDNDTVLEQTGSVLEQLTALIQDEALPAEMRETLTAMVEKMGVAMAEKDLSVLQATMAEVRGTLTEFAASDAIPAQMFRTLSEILPAVVVAEKQLGDSLPRPVTAESVPDTANLELADNVADIQTLLAEKIDILLKDESLPPEIKEQLVKIVQTMESAIEQKDFAKLVIVTTEMRQTLADFAASDAVAPQISKQLGDILPAITISEQKLADVVPRAQAENILAALIVTDPKLQSGTIVPTIETVELMQALDALKETIKQQGPEAALQKIVESLKAPATESHVLPVLEILAKNPALLESLPPELGQALAQAVAPAERTIQQHLAVAGIAADIPKAAPEKIIDVLLAVENHIGPADIKADPAKAELAKIIADIKQTIDKDGMPAAVQKITEALQQVSLDGKASPILEIIVSQPALLSALPVEMQASVGELKEFSILNNAVVTQQAEKIVDVVTVIDQQIKNGVIDKADPANAELVKIIADIKDTIKQEGLPAAAEKIAEALKTVAVEGKVPPIIEVLASQPALLAALPQDLQRSVDQIHKTALSVSVPVEKQAERIVDFVAVLDQKIQSGAIDRVDPANTELIKIVADIQKTIKEGGVPAAVEKITDALQQLPAGGKTPPIVEVLMGNPTLLATLPRDVQLTLVQVQSTSSAGFVPIRQQAEKIVQVVEILQQGIQSGAIDKTNPATEILVKAVADIKETIGKEGAAVAIQKFNDVLQKASIDGNAPPIVEILAKYPALTASLPPEAQRFVTDFQSTAAVTSASLRQPAERIADIIASIDAKIQTGAISKADPTNSALINAVKEIKATMLQGGTPAVVQKISDGLAAAVVTGKVPAIIQAAMQQPVIYASLPPQDRATLQNIQQRILTAPVSVERQAESIIQAVVAVERQLKSGQIDPSSPASAEAIKVITDIKVAMQQGGTREVVRGLENAIRAGDPRAVEIASALGQVAKSLPAPLQKVVVDVQRSAFAAEAMSATLKQQVVVITPQQKSEFQAAIKNSNLSPTEGAKYLRQIQGGQASLETVRQIVHRIEAASPAADVQKLRRELSTMESKAVVATNTPVSVKIDPVIERRVISAVAKLPVSASTLEQVKSGPITKVALANIITAAGTAPPREVRHYIQEATKQILKQESKTVVESLRNNPLPHIPPRMVQDMREGRPIPAAQIQRVIENPKTPQVTRQALERYAAVQSQVAPYVSPAALKTELKQIQKILTTTHPAVARAIETFVQRNPTARPEVFKDYVRSMPEQARAAVENAAARIYPKTEPLFRPSDPKEFIAIVERAAASASPQERVFIRELVDKARMGEPIPRSDMDHLTQVTKMSNDVHARVAANMVPAEEKSVIEGICAVCSHKNCGACKDAHLAAYEEHQKKEAKGLLSGNQVTRPEPSIFR